jgi:hypothetical protein
MKNTLPQGAFVARFTGAAVGSKGYQKNIMTKAAAFASMNPGIGSDIETGRCVCDQFMTAAMSSKKITAEERIKMFSNAFTWDAAKVNAFLEYLHDFFQTTNIDQEPALKTFKQKFFA